MHCILAIRREDNFEVQCIQFGSRKTVFTAPMPEKRGKAVMEKEFKI